MEAPGIETATENARSPEKPAAIAINPSSEAPRFATVRNEPKPVETTLRAEPTDAEIERGILDAVRMGLGDVARTLSRQLEDRILARTPNNIVALTSRKGG